MGICTSDGASPVDIAKKNAADFHSRAIDSDLNEGNAKAIQTIKLLLLGAGESGKSTLFKALIHIYGEGHSLEERQVLIPTVRSSTITAMRVLLENSNQFGPVQTSEGKEAKKVFDKTDPFRDPLDEDMSAEIVKAIRDLWMDEGIKTTYDKRANFQLVDSAKYFFERLDKISAETYVPDMEDVLQLRVRTTGITENVFHVDGNEFRMVDVGGQRNERRKWIHCFENITAIIFVAALSEYDQMLFEDEDKNRIEEAIELFEEICNSEWFVDTSMLLFLNKRDLFRLKIDKVPLTVCPLFEEYKGSGYDEGVEYIKENFLERNANPDDKEIYVHVTCATDTGNVEAVFDGVKDIIIKGSLRDAGLV